MLRKLRIENFALIDQLTLAFEGGLNVLTGETGAGKSIILDAIDAVLGGKVTGRVVRTGADRALVEAAFDMNAALAKWLVEQEIDPLDDPELVCSREVTSKDARVYSSRSRLNGVLVNKQQMESLRELLVEITAQGQTVQLGKTAAQRDWLDSFGGATLAQKREQVATAHGAARQAWQALEKRRQSEQQRLQTLDLYQYQLRELKTADLADPDELKQLEQERHRLSHAVDLQQQSYQVYQALYQNDEGGQACADLLGKAVDVLEDMLRYDDQIQPTLDLVSDALAQVQEAGRQISFYGESIEADPRRLQEVEERINGLKQICRKYGPTLADAIVYRDKIRAELGEITGGEQSLEELEKAYQTLQARLVEQCQELTQLRRETAQVLETELVAQLKPLAMDKVRFQVEITAIAPSATGADQVQFLFSPNPGEPLKPLTETASGGEMSRFLLALKACFSQVDRVGTLVFDEIDVGVSGRVAQAIADKLFLLSTHQQVLCVTHQPIVAAMATHHFRVDKQVIQNAMSSQVGPDESEPEVRTVVRVKPLDDQQKRAELAQIAGGQTPDSKDDQATYGFVDSLLETAIERQQTILRSVNPSTSP